MKKQAYMTPLCEVVSIRSERLLGMNSNNKAAVYNDDGDDVITDETKVLSRSRSVWDEE